MMDDDVCGAINEMNNWQLNRSTLRKCVSIPLCPPTSKMICPELETGPTKWNFKAFYWMQTSSS
jgi:hypothetical protein